MAPRKRVMRPAIWALALIWWLAYKMELSTAPQNPSKPVSVEEPGARRMPPLWIRNFLRRVT